MTGSRAFLLCVALRIVGMAPSHVATQEKPGFIDFYGKKVSPGKVFGQRTWREAAAGPVTGSNIYHASGVVVDRSRTPLPVGLKGVT